MALEESEQLLEEIGFTHLEARLYLLLLCEGPLRPVEVQRKLGVYKSTFYGAASALESRGLVTRMKIGKSALLKAAEPSTLVSLLGEISERVRRTIRKPSVRAKTEVEVYKGRKAVTALMRRMLLEMEKGDKSYCDFGASGRFKELLPDFWEYWQSYKVNAGIKSKVIFTTEARGVKGLLSAYAGVGRFLPPNVASFTDTFIYNDVVVLFTWLEEPVAVYISNSENAMSYRKQFEAMWQLLKK